MEVFESLTERRDNILRFYHVAIKVFTKEFLSFVEELVKAWLN
jgi:hypothetical protein